MGLGGAIDSANGNNAFTVSSATFTGNTAQGGAGGDQFRTAPLWGLGQRIFLLHDGRTTNLLTAIADHSSHGSEANTVIENFDDLSTTQQQEILDFLRSL